MTELVMDSWMCYAEDETTNYVLNVFVERQAHGGFDVIIMEHHCGKGQGCFWTPWEECYFRHFDGYQEARNTARDNLAEARADGLEIEWCAYSPARCNTMW